MIILYISNIQHNLSTGLTYSIPAHTEAQTQYDTVLWLNTVQTDASVWSDHPSYLYWDKPLQLDLFPKPFNRPDLVVFESFYQPNHMLFARKLKKANIPYIIIPHGALTRGAQQKKSLKKILGNAIGFHKFAKNAVAIHYLTEQEKCNSGAKWNSSSVIIPNGVYPQVARKDFSGNRQGKTLTYIGRLDAYHKGLDLLCEACNTLKPDLLENNIKINLYGSGSIEEEEILKTLISQYSLESIITKYPGVFNAEKENALLASDVFLLTSRFEGHPMGLIEAMAYGLPCLVTTGTNMGSEIEDFQAGWVSEVSAEGIAKSLRAMISANDLSTLGQNAIQLMKRYSWNEIAQTTHRLYGAVVENT